MIRRREGRRAAPSGPPGSKPGRTCSAPAPAPPSRGHLPGHAYGSDLRNLRQSRPMRDACPVDTSPTVRRPLGGASYRSSPLCATTLGSAFGDRQGNTGLHVHLCSGGPRRTAGLVERSGRSHVTRESVRPGAVRRGGRVRPCGPQCAGPCVAGNGGWTVGWGSAVGTSCVPMAGESPVPAGLSDFHALNVIGLDFSELLRPPSFRHKGTRTRGGSEACPSPSPPNP